MAREPGVLPPDEVYPSTFPECASCGESGADTPACEWSVSSVFGLAVGAEWSSGGSEEGCPVVWPALAVAGDIWLPDRDAEAANSGGVSGPSIVTVGDG